MSLMLMDFSNEYFWYGYTTTTNLQIQHSPNGNANVVPHGNRMKLFSLIYSTNLIVAKGDLSKITLVASPYLMSIIL